MTKCIFLQTLVHVIIDNFDIIISNTSKDSDQKLHEFANDIYNISFLLLVVKILYYYNKAVFAVAVLYIYTIGLNTLDAFNFMINTIGCIWAMVAFSTIERFCNSGGKIDS